MASSTAGRIGAAAGRPWAGMLREPIQTRFQPAMAVVDGTYKCGVDLALGAAAMTVTVRMATAVFEGSAIDGDGDGAEPHVRLLSFWARAGGS